MLMSIDSASHWVILAKDIERFRRDLPILPLNENVVSRTLKISSSSITLRICA
jgi:hypothetical protein